MTPTARSFWYGWHGSCWKPRRLLCLGAHAEHVHLLLRTGAAPLPTLMRRLLTGYAVRFNHRHHRHGLLFQNRYKSVVCQEDLYFTELVRYIHLNPLRAGIVASVPELSRYPYGGHSALLGTTKRPWQATEYVLGTSATSGAGPPSL